MRKNYAVFGLGRYGRAVAIELTRSGAEVLAVDADPQLVNNFSTDIPICKCADITDAEVIRQLGRLPSQKGDNRYNGLPRHRCCS